MPLRTRRPVRLALDPLETRDTPAGTVTATFAGGALTLVGDSADNAVTVNQLADGRLALTGNLGTTIGLNGAPAISSVTLPAPLTRGLTAAWGAGNDQLTLNGVELPASLTVNGGPGDNSLVLAGRVVVNGNLTETNGAGFDTTLLNGPVTVAGGMAIANGPGGALVDDDSSTELQVTGALTITGSAGPDSVALGDAARITAGSIRVAGGPGANQTDIGPAGPLAVARSVQVTGGPDADTVRLEGGSVAVGGNVSIRLGGGANDAHVQSGMAGLFVGGSVSITGGAGTEDVTVGAPTAPTAIGGGVTVSVGVGGSTQTIQGSRLTVGGAVRVAARAGTDTVLIRSLLGDGSVGRDVTVGLGTGDGQTVGIATLTNGTTLSVGGALRVTTADTTPAAGGDNISVVRVGVRLGTQITTGAGRDTVTIDDSIFQAFALTTGGGADVVEVERADSAGTTRFFGPVRVSTGDGDDGVRVGNNNPGIAQAVFAAAQVWDGGPGGADSLVLNSTGNQFYGPDPVITGFENMS
ncbi:MAG TPA: hypothetical protein VKD90_27050 [Gemmataceae bacterium]|nr:hypothetical protein [Gemmataceae bacterium]